jgi:predicted Zn-dependent peptidase
LNQTANRVARMKIIKKKKMTTRIISKSDVNKIIVIATIGGGFMGAGLYNSLRYYRGIEIDVNVGIAMIFIGIGIYEYAKYALKLIGKLKYGN